MQTVKFVALSDGSVISSDPKHNPDEIVKFAIAILDENGNYPLVNFLLKVTQEAICPACSSSSTAPYNPDTVIRNPKYRYCFDCGHEFEIE